MLSSIRDACQKDNERRRKEQALKKFDHAMSLSMSNPHENQMRYNVDVKVLEHRHCSSNGTSSNSMIEFSTASPPFKEKPLLYCKLFFQTVSTKLPSMESTLTWDTQAAIERLIRRKGGFSGQRWQKISRSGVQPVSDAVYGKHHLQQNAPTSIPYTLQDPLNWCV